MQKSGFNMEQLKGRNILTAWEACFYIGVSRATFDKKLRKREEFPQPLIFGYGTGHGGSRMFFYREDLDKWIDSRVK